MTTAVPAHAVSLALTDDAPGELPVGASFTVVVEVACGMGCDLHSRHSLSIMMPDGTRAAHPIEPLADGISTTAPIELSVPPRAGRHVWSAALMASGTAGARHLADPLEIAVDAVPNATSLAVWSLPDAVVSGARFSVNVGAKSSAGVGLGGRVIEICDSNGAVAACAELQLEPWPATAGLYWARLDLVAPATIGVSTWTARFSASDISLPHEGSECAFSVAVVAKPEHRVRIRVLDKVTAVPVADAVVRAGAYRGATDAFGLAEIELPVGACELVVWKAGYDVPTIGLTVSGDSEVCVEALPVPEEDPDARWLA